MPDVPRWVRPVVLVAAAVALFAVIFLVTGCTGTVTTVLAPSPSPSEQGNREAVRALGSQHCGLERWPVKTGTDADAGMVSLTAPPVPVTVAQLTTLPAPAVLPQANRVRPVETTVYQVKATLAEFKVEADSDVHLVLSDGGQTMIAEIPDPACVGAGSPFLPQITAARSAFDARFHPSDVWQHAGVAVVVTGVGFFDSLHGQTGVAPNGIELHPVLDITPGTAATP